MSQIDITRKIATYKKKINVKNIDRVRNEYDENFVNVFDYFTQKRRVVLFKKKKKSQIQKAKKTTEIF